ncbi:CTD nuclear envelope phosphatase 1 homolog isoform X2 [Anthonomus grandis grandis]|uniref:CTD nuclear envelope phosphatase 1 homolog isoform X2 n=1 Tax=Anthonomus grandis grandis TaxID=2921223 RepID=UPI002165447E|nr:CTD nuclear envelope phosphatase 1 homolog isoform X2 [Anthonomus grandis grandis]
MWKQLEMGLRAFLLIASRIWTCLCFTIRKQTRAVIRHQSVKYDLFPLSPLSRHRLSIVKRKVLVLDLDETLIHSHHDGVVRQTVRPGVPPDFVLKVTIDRHPVRFFVHKRPHVDFFLDIVSQWYELVVFTASMEIYGAAVADKLDGGRCILQRRFYRQHCTPDFGSYTKDLSAICNDLSSVFILDNSPGAYKAYPDNAIPIKSWFSDPSDVALLNLLPVLDALRFTADVRSVLSRNLHLHRLCGGNFGVSPPGGSGRPRTPEQQSAEAAVTRVEEGGARGTTTSSGGRSDKRFKSRIPQRMCN